MPQVIVNPDEMRRFARYLEGLAEGVRGKKHATNLGFENLKESWRDAKYRQFEKVYVDTSAELDRFAKTAVAYAKYLDRKAALADRYLGGR